MSDRLLLIFFITTIGLSANAQFGIRASYNLNNAPGWDNFFAEAAGSTEKVFSSSMTFSLDYWIRLPNHRIEFYPNLSYHSAQSSIVNNAIGAPALEIKLRQIGVGILTHIYLLDLIGDCDCPTFSKQGGAFKKGFFIMGGIGADFSDKEFANRGFADRNIDFKVSLGLGFDVGITDLITITPFAQYQYYPSISWHEIGQALDRPINNVESSLGQLQLGIRIGFRPDYK